MKLKEDVKQLAFQVPSPPGEPLPAGATDEAIDGLELRTGWSVPAALREWLRFSNGPCIGPGGLLGIGPRRSSLDIETVLQWYPGWRERGWIPVAGDGMGNYYVLNCNDAGGAVCFIDTALDADHLAYVVGSGLWRFLRFLLERELGNNGWPFSPEYVVSKDPDILRCAAAPMPWSDSRPEKHGNP